MDQPPLQKVCRHADLLALGFGTTVAMWAVGYVGRFPRADIPVWLVAAGLLGCQFIGGAVAGRHTSRGWRGGLAVGLLSSILNILVLGSLLSGNEPNRVVPSALLWVPGALAIGAAAGTLGAVIGARRPSPRAPGDIPWFAWFTRVAAAATFGLIVIGGVVTSEGAGLAVVDWPNSFGYNMFLYPLSKMGGGIYYEHAHRLFGSLVGLTTLVLAIHLWIYDRRGWMKWLAVAAVALVITQGILGGLRVTGRFTWSTSREEVAPNLYLAVAHGVVGQVFFGLMVALGVFTSGRWLVREAPAVRRSASADRTLSVVLVGLLVVQLVLGAIQRHLMRGLEIHITLGILTAVLATACGVRAWGLYPDRPILPRLGKYLLIGIGVQVLLGMSALVAKGLTEGSSVRPLWRVVITTSHQAVGALLLAMAVLLVLWSHRLVAPQAPDARLFAESGR